MYDPEERFYIWQEYKEAVSQLFNDIDKRFDRHKK